MKPLWMRLWNYSRCIQLRGNGVDFKKVFVSESANDDELQEEFALNAIEMTEDVYAKFLRAISPHHLELRLFATEKCNFRCVYCYEDFELGRMAPKVRRGVKALMTQRVETGLRSLFVSWFGGEPLLALDVIEDIENHRNDLIARFPQLDSQVSSITTNGYLLTPEVLKKLVNLGVRRYQITLDGPNRLLKYLHGTTNAHPATSII